MNKWFLSALREEERLVRSIFEDGKAKP